jgi:hypothetical protein
MKPIATSETKQEQRKSHHREGFELENLDISPGNTLRDRRRIEELHSPTSPVQDVVEVLQVETATNFFRRTDDSAK